MTYPSSVCKFPSPTTQMLQKARCCWKLQGQRLLQLTSRPVAWYDPLSGKTVAARQVLGQSPEDCFYLLEWCVCKKCKAEGRCCGTSPCCLQFARSISTIRFSSLLALVVSAQGEQVCSAETPHLVPSTEKYHFHCFTVFPDQLDLLMLTRWASPKVLPLPPVRLSEW